MDGVGALRGVYLGQDEPFGSSPMPLSVLAVRGFGTGLHLGRSSALQPVPCDEGSDEVIHERSLHLGEDTPRGSGGREAPGRPAAEWEEDTQ